MTTMELEAYRAELARAILETEDWNLLDKVRRIVLPKSKKRAKAVEEEEPVMSDEEVREGLKEAFRCAALQGRCSMNCKVETYPLFDRALKK